jgi:hypothetical protein
MNWQRFLYSRVARFTALPGLVVLPSSVDRARACNRLQPKKREPRPLLPRTPAPDCDLAKGLGPFAREGTLASVVHRAVGHGDAF